MIRRKTIICLSVLITSFSLIFFLFSGSEKIPLSDDEIKNGINFNGSEPVLDIETEKIYISGFKPDFVTVSYSEDELNIMAETCEEELKRLIINNNSDFINITEKLCFPNAVSKYPFSIMYDYETNLFDYDGNILCDEPFDSILYITLSYGSFCKSLSIPVHVEPDVETINDLRKQKFINNLTSAISDENAMMGIYDNKLIRLPGNVNGENVKYYYSGKEKNYLYLALGPIASLLLFWGYKKDMKDAVKKRNERIISEYPKMIQKMALYLASGMNIRNIWILICEEELRKGKNVNPLYEQMQLSANEMQSGIAESTVYKRFGMRISIPEIVRFSALLSQNLKKGNTKLREQLNEEAQNAFVKRKNYAIKKSEEAGIKLLMPLMILLLDIMIVIILPAFWSI